MGIFDRWLTAEAPPAPLLARNDPEPDISPIANALYDLIAQRRASFTMADALRLPAVVRAVSLITSVAASFHPLAYRDGRALPDQPRILTRPDPFSTRFDFTSMVVRGLVEDGCAILRLSDFDGDRPRQAMVLPHDEVVIDWSNNQKVKRSYVWRGAKIPDRQVLHITIGRRPGELHGRGPLREGLPYLAASAAAEDFARDFFATGGIPQVLIRAIGSIPPSTSESQDIKRQWIESRQTGSEPAVFGKDFEFSFPSVDPQKGQMQESRAYGATIAARLLGIPGALLQIETSGATITYTNPAGALEDLVKTTVAPVYLAPVEAALSDLVPANQSVRYDLADLQRADFAARAAIYAQLVPLGVMTPAEARAAEGWAPLPTTDPSEASHAFDPTPVPTDSAPVEVPEA